MNNPNDELREQIELGKALNRLEVNDDFIKVITNGYIINTLLNKSENLLDANPTSRQETLEKMQSVIGLKRHLTELRNMASTAAEDFSAEEN